jgi:malate dehydrogenase (quinone)
MTASTGYDCLIVGGGVSGTALLYELARFTDLKRLCLLEKHDRPAQANSHAHNNSQTLHWGDIETQLDPDQALRANRSAAMVVNYATRLAPRDRDRIIQRMSRMVLGVGAKECVALRQRYELLKPSFPRLRLLEAQDIADIEPNVALVQGSWRKDEILGLGMADDWTAADYRALSESFSTQCVRLDRLTDRHVTQLYGTDVTAIRKEGDFYVLDTSRGLMQARSVVVCAGGHGLHLAQGMGLGQEFAFLPVVGTYYTAPDMLSGKVFRMQKPGRPFPALHGGPDFRYRRKTRFGPISMMLARVGLDHKPRLGDFLALFRHEDADVAATIRGMVKRAEVRADLARDLLYRMPLLARGRLAAAVREIVPAIKPRDIEFTAGVGGIRPQIIDKSQRALRLEDTRLTNGAGLIFNLTPSPGGTGCLGQAERDMRQVAHHLGARIDWHAFQRELLEGEVPGISAPTELARAS